MRCLYCGAESFVRWDVLDMQVLQRRVGTAQKSLAQAMEALSKRADFAALETHGRVYIIAGLLVVPLIWSFVARCSQATGLCLLHWMCGCSASAHCGPCVTQVTRIAVGLVELVR